MKSHRLINSLYRNLALFALGIYALFVAVLCTHFFALEKAKFDTLSHHASLTLKSSIMVKDEIAIRASLNRLLEIEDILGVQVSGTGFDTIQDSRTNFAVNTALDSSFVSLLTSEVISFQHIYKVYPSSNEIFGVRIYFINKVRRDILVYSLIVTVLMVLIFLILVTFGTKKLVNREMLGMLVDVEKSKLASRIFHLMKSDIKQMIELIDQSRELAKEKRVLMRTILRSIHGTSCKFMNGSTENAYSLDRYESVKVQSILSEMITRKTLEYSRRADFSITLKEDFSLSSNIFLKTVPEELKRAISNIVDNSFDAVDGKGEIEFKVECGNGLIEIRISDNGRGIPEDQIPHIFTMGKSFKAHGNGFGLSQAKEIVSSLGGEIDISSKVGVGTTVRITLLQDGEDSVLESVSTENFDFILIDDSKIRRLNSKKRADLKGKKLAIFKDVTEFLSSSFLPSINRTTPIYLDSDLGEHQPGEILAKTLFYEVGFKNIILYTAGNLEELRSKPMPWLSAIIGKDEVQNLPV